MSARPYVILDRPGLVHELCQACGGSGQGESYGADDRPRAHACYCCAGKGYIVTEAPKPADPFAAIADIIDQAAKRMDEKGMP